MGRIKYHTIQKEVNEELLHDQLREALGKVFIWVESVNGFTRIALHTPTDAQIATATQLVQAHDASALTDAQQTLQTIKDLILGAVGKEITDLTTAERWALLGGLLYQNKALAPDMTVRHPKHWIARQDTDDD